jgi:hypothetical protein
VKSVEVDRAQAEIRASVRRPIPRWHVGAAIALGILLILVTGFASGGSSTPSRSGATYTTAAGHVHANLIPDSVAYLQMADAHHGGLGSDMAPFTARWLVPTVAGLLPVDAGVGIQLVNLALLIAGMVSLVLLISNWVRHSATLVVAVVLFSAAVPVLQYASAYLVDAAAVGFVAIGIWAAYRLPLLAPLAVLAVGVMAKETVLILVAFGITLELMRNNGTRQRVSRAGAWALTGGLAYLTAQRVGGTGRLVFVPWLPHDLHYLDLLLRANLSRGDAWILTGLSLAVPILSVVIAFWTSRRHWFHIAPARLVPLAVGVGCAMLLSTWAATAAWWDARSAWMSLPFGVPVAALLVDAVLDRGLGSTVRDRRFYKVVLGAGALGFGCLVAAALVSGVLPFRAFQSGESTPRLTAATAQPVGTRIVTRHGEGTTRLDVPDVGDDRAVALDVEVPKPTALRIETPGASQPLFDDRIDKTGTFLLDPDGPQDSVTITVDGPWTARFRSLNTVSTWGGFASLSGHGPDVVLIPGSNRFSASALFTSSTNGSHFQLVGACHVPDCPDESAGELPIGLEALVVNDPGDWAVIPQKAHQKDDAVRFSDLQ